MREDPPRSLADAAEWIGTVVAERCENVTLCIDAFHIIGWATEALDKGEARCLKRGPQAGMTGHAAKLKGCRCDCGKTPRTSPHVKKQSSPSSQRSTRRLYHAPT